MRLVLIITLLSIIGSGCRSAKTKTATTTKESLTFPEGELTVPTILSLNNADAAPFCVTLKNSKRYVSFSVTIYNRWGQKIWNADKQSSCWDATTIADEKKVLVPQGVYFVLVEATTSDKQNYKYTGSLTVV